MQQDQGVIIKIKNNFFNVEPSTRKNKKYDVYLLNDNDRKYLFSVGSSLHQHYKDKLGYYKDLDHLDETRKKRYYQRHGHTNDIFTAKWWASRLLW